MSLRSFAVQFRRRLGLPLVSLVGSFRPASRRDANRFCPELLQFEDRTVPVAVVGVTASDTVVGSDTGGLSFVRTNDDLSGTLTVTYSVGGSAVPGTDYTPLPGTVTFAVGQNDVEVPVTALNPTGGTTVTATINSSPNYTTDPTEPSATSNIAAQPVNVSVFMLSNGSEGNVGGPLTNGAFQFARSGDLSAPLTATYTVGGTAQAGTIYQPLTQSVTFGAGQAFATVPVVVLPPTGPATPTLTVTVTVTPGTGYGVGNSSDTIFIQDANTRQVVWTGNANDGKWETAGNWVVVGSGLQQVPQSGDNVFFNSGSVSCTDAGYQMTSLYGLHLVGSYTGTVTLWGPLGVGTYEQTTGILNQAPVNNDLTSTTAFIWSGGTFNGLNSGANLNINGVGQIIPPGNGTLSLGSTLNVGIGAILNVLPGALNFAGGNGLVDNGQVNVPLNEPQRTNVLDTWTKPAFVPGQVTVSASGSLTLTVEDTTKIGAYTLGLPFVNQGNVTMGSNGGLRFTDTATVNGVPSISSPGFFTWYTGSDIYVSAGMSVTGGIYITADTRNTKATLDGTLTVGDAQAKTTPTISINLPSATFLVNGDCTWLSGKYNLKFTPTDINRTASLWEATGLFTIGAQTTINPTPYGQGAVQRGGWLILSGKKGIKGTTDGHGVVGPQFGLTATGTEGEPMTWIFDKNS
jgi:hypothetical protein